ncbi:MAG: glycosyltransferase family 39 protein [Bacteroidia bacterium]|nr:glycosyltransferase family 39 protein [Bacteroidia bacterium]
MSKGNLIINNSKQIEKQFYFNDTFKRLILFSISLLIVKLCLLPLIHTVDSDGVSRIFISLGWLKNPYWIKGGNWGPFHFYLMGSALKILNNQFYTPLILNIVLSSATLFPLYFFFKRLHNESTALILCFLFSLSPIIFRLSLLTLAETPYLFFVILSANLLYKGLDEKKILYVFLGGLITSIAGGFRYEIWILSTLFSILILIKYSKKDFLVFNSTALIFPCIWLISNYLDSGYFLNSFKWADLATETNKIDSIESFLRRIWFYPLSLIFAFGPIAFFYFIKTIIKTYKNIEYKKTIITFSIVFSIVFIIFLFNTLRGSLLLQHRFTITLFIICFPMFGYYFNTLNKKKIIMALVFGFTGFILAFAYSSKGARPIPRLLSKEANEINNIVKSNVSIKSGLIIDFWNWESTYCIAFMSNLPRNNIVLVDQNSDLNFISDEIKRIVTEKPNGYLLICSKGLLNNVVTIKQDTIILIKDNIHFPIKMVKNYPDASLYEYTFN